MIKVLLFAHLQESIGKSEIVIQQSPLNGNQLMEELYTFFNPKDINNAMLAVNEEYISQDELNDLTIQTGDTVALIPPVSGG